MILWKCLENWHPLIYLRCLFCSPGWWIHRGEAHWWLHFRVKGFKIIHFWCRVLLCFRLRARARSFKTNPFNIFYTRLKHIYLISHLNALLAIWKCLILLEHLYLGLSSYWLLLYTLIMVSWLWNRRLALNIANFF